MKYIFEFDFNTDGDYGFDFVPVGMERNFEDYSFRRVYDNKEEAVAGVISICQFLSAGIICVDSKREYFEEAINNFIDEIRHIKADEQEFNIVEYMYGNYDGTEFRFYAEPNIVNFRVKLTDEEIEFLNDNASKLSPDKIKQAIFNLIKEN